jgi:hypothetical protein
VTGFRLLHGGSAHGVAVRMIEICPQRFPMKVEGAEGDMSRLARHAVRFLGGVARKTWPLGRRCPMFSGEYSRLYEREFPAFR